MDWILLIGHCHHHGPLHHSVLVTKPLLTVNCHHKASCIINTNQFPGCRTARTKDPSKQRGKKLTCYGGRKIYHAEFYIKVKLEKEIFY